MVSFKTTHLEKETKQILGTTSHPEGQFGPVVILVSSEPGPDGSSALNTVCEKINVEEDKAVQLHPFLPELDHQVPQDVPGAAQVHHCGGESKEVFLTQFFIYNHCLCGF